MQCSKDWLLDHLVGTGEQRWPASLKNYRTRPSPAIRSSLCRSTPQPRTTCRGFTRSVFRRDHSKKNSKRCSSKANEESSANCTRGPYRLEAGGWSSLDSAQRARHLARHLVRNSGSGLRKVLTIPWSPSGEHLGTGGRELHVGPAFMPPQPAQRNGARERGAELIRCVASFQERVVDQFDIDAAVASTALAISASLRAATLRSAKG
jgi:hypothetical protein